MTRLILIFLLSINIILKGQEKPIEDYYIGRKVNSSNNLNTGRLQVTIPLFNVDMGGGTFDSSLNYTSDLNQIDVEPSIVGKNWNLNLLGKIVISNPYGYRFLQSRSPYSSFSDGFESYPFPDCYFSNTTTTPKYLLYNNPEQNILSRYEPTKYYFDFFGYTGYFLQDNNGKFLVFSENGNLKIEFNGDKCFDVTSPLQNNLPGFIITDDNGTKFFFGEDYNTLDIYYTKTNLDYSSSNNASQTSVVYKTNSRSNYVAGLYLKKVILNNGREINFTYKNGNSQLLKNFTNGGIYVNQDFTFQMPDNQTLLNNNLFIGFDKGKSYSYRSIGLSNYGTSLSDVKTTIYQKLAIIEKISISDYGSIEFDYINGGNVITKPFTKKIDFKDVNNKIIHKVVFDYENVPNNTTLLKKLLINEQEYNFEYYNDVDQIIKDNNTGYSYTTGKNGLLKSVLYPNRGKESFQYEQNYVSKINEVGGSLLGDLKNINAFVDGQRLMKITKFDGEKSTEKSFNYTNDNGTSSGILEYRDVTSDTKFDLPVYSSDVTASITQKFKGYLNNNVKYSTVIENLGTMGLNKYYYTDIVSNPDSLAQKYTYNYNVYPSYPFGAKPLKIDKSNERGKLLEIKKYNNNSDLVFDQKIKYTNFLNNINAISVLNATSNVNNDRYYIEATQFRWGIKEGFFVYRHILPYLPISITTKELTSDKSKYLEKIKSIKYNDKYLYWHPYAIEEKTESLGKILSKKTYYPGDILRKNSSCIVGNCPPDTDLVGEKFSIYTAMINDNINYPIIISSTNDSNKSSLVENIYKKDNTSNNKLKLDKKRISLLDNNFNSDFYNQALMKNQEFFDFYDDNGNLLQQRNADGKPSTTVWGYNQTLPIAKVEGATYAEVMAAFKLNESDLNSYKDLDIVKKSDLDNEESEQNLLQSLDNFKSKPELNKYQITTYTHDPLIGVRSITPPNGTREKYLYDSANRLEKILDKDDRIIKEFKYKYAPKKFYNDKQERKIYKNDCPYWQLAGSYTYVVPAETYFSYENVEAANQMAIAEINQKGQQAANQYGGCQFISCKLNPNYYITLQGYNSIQQTQPNHIEVILVFKADLTGLGMSYTSGSGVSVGYIEPNCRPNSVKVINQTNWTITIDTNGYVMVRSNNGSSPPNGTPVGVSFGYDK